MPRYIDADYLLGTYQAVCSAVSCEECRAKYKDGTCKVEHWLKAQPTIDAVEVVRCKDCKFYSPNNGGGCTRCGGLEYLVTADEYCSKGERKETDNG